MDVNSSKIGLILVTALGLLFAWFAGNYVADENYLPIVAVLGFLGTSTFFFGFGKRIYLLIPICWGLTGQISLLPLPFSVRQLIIIAASIFFITIIIFKGNKDKIRYEIIDVILAINLLYLLIVFFRNPVGIAALGGSDRVGGKPYVDVLLSIMAYLMISRQKISPRFAKSLPLFIVGVSIFSTVAPLVGLFLPSIGMKLAPLYSGFSPSLGLMSESDAITVGETRLDSLSTSANYIILYIVSNINPIQILHPKNILFLIFYCISLIMVLLSGFRNTLFNVFITTFIGAVFRERIVGVVKMMSFITIMIISIILISYTSIKIPYTFSRALSFLPGNWDQAAVLEARESTEWRTEMWKIVLTSDRYIRSKIWGDGFGFLRTDYELMIDAGGKAGQAFGGMNSTQEAFMINGDFHSGPVSTIRFVGFFGLILFIPLLISLSIYSYKTIKLAFKTPYQACALFLGIPCLIFPVIFIFIFGDFKIDLVNTIFNISMLKMLRRSCSKNVSKKQVDILKKPII